MTERRSKYNARRATEDGYTFDSMAEYRRYAELKLMQGAGQISKMEVHPVFELIPPFCYQGHKERAVKYEADFRYYDEALGDWIIEDVKGVETDVFKLKRKLLLWKYPNLIFKVVQA